MGIEVYLIKVSERSLEELLGIVLHNTVNLIGKREADGICGVISKLYKADRITLHEKIMLDRLIQINSPGCWGHTYFYFEPGLIGPRIEYLENLLKQIKDEK